MVGKTPTKVSSYTAPKNAYFANLARDTGLPAPKLKALHKLYFHSKAAYKGVQAVYREAREQGLNATQAECKLFLSSQPVYSLYQPARKRVSENKIKVESIGKRVRVLKLRYLFTAGTLQIDLMDVHQYAEDNAEYNFLLCALDSFSRYLFVHPQRNKTQKASIKGLEKILATVYKIDTIYCDKESGFHGGTMTAWRKRHEIGMYSVLSKETQAPVLTGPTTTTAKGWFSSSPLVALIRTVQSPTSTWLGLFGSTHAPDGQS
jgi:hypothetical protein